MEANTEPVEDKDQMILLASYLSAVLERKLSIFAETVQLWRTFLWRPFPLTFLDILTSFFKYFLIIDIAVIFLIPKQELDIKDLPDSLLDIIIGSLSKTLAFFSNYSSSQFHDLFFPPEPKNISHFTLLNLRSRSSFFLRIIVLHLIFTRPQMTQKIFQKLLLIEISFSIQYLIM